MNHVLWWVAAIVIGILTFLYILGLYFTYFDDPKEFDRTFRNNLEQRIRPVPSARQDRGVRKTD